MERQMLEDHLALAERHVEDGKRRVADQRERAYVLEEDGHHGVAIQARALLSQLEEIMAIYIAESGPPSELASWRPAVG
jgi:hypothetical protein